RSDVSFTLFLAEPESYEGGALVIESAAGEQEFRLAAGSMVVYPSTTLHRVAPVQNGERLAAVGWARSFIRSADQREILFDLENARRDIFDAHGKTPAFNQLSKCSANLLRLWLDDYGCVQRELCRRRGIRRKSRQVATVSEAVDECENES